MGLLDDLSDGINRGIGQADRALQAGRIKSSISSLMKTRDDVLRSLGHHVYGVSRREEIAVEGVGEYLTRLRDIEMQIAQAQSELEALNATHAGPHVACATCGAANPVGAAFCVGCGNRLVAVASGTCVHCGGPLAGDAKFCTRCGNVVAPAVQPVEPTPEAVVETAPTDMAGEDQAPAAPTTTATFCTGCGASVQSDLAFCPSCGTGLK